MEFQILGPVRVVDGDRDLTPVRPKQRALLAMLLLRRGDVVPREQLIEALWGEEPPDTAPTALHGHVSALRKLLGAESIETRPPGYLLHVPAGAVDLARFETLIAAARKRLDPEERSSCLGEALALWRGEPLADLRYEPFAQSEISRIEELRLGALEDRFDADLALGRHHEIVAELEPLVAAAPFRERTRAQLMLALYRCGRQTDALQVFQSGRKSLVEEVGIEPGPALQQLELRILRQDPSLELPPLAAPRDGDQSRRLAPAPSSHPRSEVFVGRVRELERLEEALAAVGSGMGATALVSGDAGIGKTRLASELAARARAGGFGVLVGRCLDLVGTELPYQPFVDALRALVPELPLVDGRSEGSQLRVFEKTLEVIAGLANSAPVLLVLEDLHWADPSTLDLVVFLAHNIEQQRVLLLATYRADEPSSAKRMRRLADGVRRSGSPFLVELGPLKGDELQELLATHAYASLPAARVDAIAVRSEGNPFFAEELLAAAVVETGELPRGLSDLLLQRVARLDGETQRLLGLAAAAGRDVGYPLLCAAAARPERDVRESLRRAVEHGVLVADHATGTFRFRHALLAEAIYATLLPGEREELHARLADVLTRADPPAAAAELAPHWAAAGRPREALVASIAAAREAEAVFGLAEALAHLERALALWDDVPDAAELAGLDLAELSAWAAEQAFLTGAAPRAVELGRQTISLLGDGDPVRVGLLHADLGRYLFIAGRRDAAVAALERAVELVPPEPPSPERAQVLAALGSRLMLTWRHEESLRICEQALALARAVGPRAAEIRALGTLGVDLAYLGHRDDGLAALWQALRLAEETRAPRDLDAAYIWLTDVLTMLGRPRESARLAAEGTEVIRCYGIEYGPLLANHVEALVATGEWERADRVSAAALRANTANWPHNALVTRAELEAGRGDFDVARAHLDAALATVRQIERGSLRYDLVAVELALWEGRWTDVDEGVREGMVRASAPDAALFRVQLCAQGLRAQAELASLARARDDADALDGHLGRARKLLTTARRAAADAAAVTPNGAGWGALAEAEHARARGDARPEAWTEAAHLWDKLERPPLTAYCHWRQAEALVAAGAAPADAVVPLNEAHAVAVRIGAQPLLLGLELLAERARLDLAPLDERRRSA